MKKFLTLMGFVLMISTSAQATCYRATGQDGHKAGFQPGTIAGATQVGKMILRNACQRDGSSLDGSSFQVEDSWCQYPDGLTSLNTVCWAAVYGCCN